jgi:ApeA N-terminal domain 1
LNYGNEFSLRKRLKELLDQFWKNLLEDFVSNKSTFVKNIVNTRNYLTHYDEDLKDKAVQGEGLYYLNERLKLFLIILLLDQLGIPRNDIFEIINNHGRFNYLKIKSK